MERSVSVDRRGDVWLRAGSEGVAGVMVALEGNFGYSFLRGVFAAVNPCGFVMLPAYLTYFLGVDDARTSGTDGRAGIGRALAVSAAVSAGFVFVFTVIGRWCAR